ncbi:MAG: ABC transporter permease [Bryobacterales bacterium]|nr:ABC transporter permease [Bryobacterales bacterium]MDE0260947.1 ABC transporter permease [Bryobacterales bacterium]MDE0621529.1 ABC transporter permease [Bryobacterales bacterium]
MARPLSGARLRAAALTLPLLAFVAVTFMAPLGSMLVRSFYEPHVADALPQTLESLRAWDGSSVPDENTFRILATELRLLDQQRKLGGVATRINRLEGGMRSAIMDTARALRDAEPDSWREAMTAADPAWGTEEAWRAVRRAGERYTMRHYLNALDLDRDPSGNIVAQSPERRIYLPLLLRTLGVSLAITVICLILGYPVAYLIANASPGRSNLLLLLVLVPFWTSLLVRTTSWIVLLQNQGVVNDLLVAVGVIGDDGRLALVYNMVGTLVAMTQVLLPFMILPLYAVMRSISPTYLRAASSLGATFPQGFVRVYWPQSLPGVAAGSLLVFILSIGYYITPALVGGRTGQLISNMIAYHMQESLNWGLAAALGVILLVTVMSLYLVYNRLVGIERMRLS